MIHVPLGPLQVLPALLRLVIHFMADLFEGPRLTTEVDRQGIVSDGDSEDDTFSDNESENERLR